MRANVNLLTILGAFFALLAAVYITWAMLTYGRVEWVGTLGLSLDAVWAEIDDRHGEHGGAARGAELAS